MPGGEFLQKEDVVTDEIVRLPDNFIGKDDQARLESFGAYLIVHGCLSTSTHVENCKTTLLYYCKLHIVHS